MSFYKVHGALGLVSSGEKSASSVAIKGTPGVLGGVCLKTDGTNDATATLYDDPDSADGTILWEGILPGATQIFTHSFNPVIVFDQGCYLVLSGTNATAVVYYY